MFSTIGLRRGIGTPSVSAFVNLEWPEADGLATAGSQIDGEQYYHNSCFQVDPRGRFEQTYSKMKLVPFSEQVPYQEHLPFMRKDFLRK